MLSYNIFPLKSQADENDAHRSGSIVLEEFETTFNVASNTADAEVPTTLTEVIGVIPKGLSKASFGAGVNITSMTTDGVITSGAVTVRVVTAGLIGAISLGGFLIGRLGTTNIISNSP